MSSARKSLCEKVRILMVFWWKFLRGVFAEICVFLGNPLHLVTDFFTKILWAFPQGFLQNLLGHFTGIFWENPYRAFPRSVWLFMKIPRSGFRENPPRSFANSLDNISIFLRKYYISHSEKLGLRSVDCRLGLRGLQGRSQQKTNRHRNGKKKLLSV